MSMIDTTTRPADYADPHAQVMERFNRWQGCIRAGLDAETTCAILAVVADRYRWQTQLSDVAEMLDTRDRTAAEVTQLLARILPGVIPCYHCDGPLWDGLATVVGGESFHNACADYWTRCAACGDATRDDDTTSTSDGRVCWHCYDCFYYYCEYCDETYHTDDGHHHDDEEASCECSAKVPRFTFPANGFGTITQDERLTVTMPTGVIDREGLKRIAELLSVNLPGAIVRDSLAEIGPEWQTKRGNFTRRLSRDLHANRGGAKVDGATLSQIGNIAREHSGAVATWEIELTRDFNLPAADFVHEESCYWQSYYESRCALKHWGAIGLRTFDECNDPVGRAWVQPLNENLTPTHDAIGAKAYVVYNAYGELGGYEAARIIAYLAGMTYRKVELSLCPQYVNSDAGYLVADEATCSSHDSITCSFDAHWSPR